MTIKTWHLVPMPRNGVSLRPIHALELKHNYSRCCRSRQASFQPVNPHWHWATSAFTDALEPLAYHPGHADRLQSRGGSRRPGMIRIRHDASVTTTEPAIAVAGDWSWI